ncbi:MAG: DUF2208 family protein [Nitrososphaeria archaeon]|jgi:uncharacterized membrane protein
MEAVSNEIDVTELKKADRKRTIIYAIGLILVEFFVMLLALILFSYIGLIVLLVFVFIFFPSPYHTMPQKYTISNGSIMFDGKKIVKIPLNFKVKTNADRMFVSIKHPRRGEVLRLYSRDPVELSEILENIRKKE